MIEIDTGKNSKFQNSRSNRKSGNIPEILLDEKNDYHQASSSDRVPRIK